MTDAMEVVAGSEFKDRKTGLVVFGILGIIAGALCVLTALGMVLGIVGGAHAATQPAADPDMTAKTMISAVVVYAAMAVWFIWMGIGSIQARRWARALIVITSWLGLSSGLIGFTYILLLRPNPFGPMVEAGKMPPAAAMMATAFLLGAMFVLYIIVPGILVLFYGSKHVKATCERRDPHVRWTDKCPLPVLALCLACGLGACCMPLMGFYGWAMPFFGTIIAGAAGAVVMLILMALNAYIAWGSYHLEVRAWWAALLLVIFWAVSYGVTFSHFSMADLYAKMGYPPQTVEMMKSAMPSQSGLLASCGVWLVVVLAYLMYTRRFFAKPAAAEN